MKPGPAARFQCDSLRGRPLRLGMNQRIREGAERLTKVSLTCWRSPCRPGSRTGISDAAVATLSQPSTARWTKIARCTRGNLSSHTRNSLRPAPPISSAIWPEEIPAADRSSSSMQLTAGLPPEAGAAKAPRIELLHASYGRFDEVMAGRIDGCLFLGAGIDLDLLLLWTQPG